MSDTAETHADYPIDLLVTEAGRPRNRLDHSSDERFTDHPVVAGRGIRIPRLGLGTWQLDAEQAEESVGAALEIGYRHFDTAQMYGNESGVGAAIDGSGVARSDVFVTTKIDNHNHEPDDLVRSVEESLQQLRLDHVDLLLVHWPVHWDRIGATMAALAQVQAGGLARHIGVSNFTIEQLEAVADLAPLQVLQAECHVYFQQRELRRWCRENDWAFTAYSPLAKGAVIGDRALADVARSHDVEETGVALAWLLAQDGVSAIPRSTDLDHLEANWHALTIDLTADELDWIGRLDRGDRLIDPDFAPW